MSGRRTAGRRGGGTTVRAAAVVLVVTVALGLATACVGSGKTAHGDELGALPLGFTIVSDTTSGCRDGESGFDYRFVVIKGNTNLSTNGPFLSALRDNGFTWSNPFTERLPWTTVTYQHVLNPDGTQYALGLEIGPLSRYLANPKSHQGPDPNSLPAEVRAHPENYLLVAMRPTDFLCTSPL